jgi:hypothetical protein
MAGGRPGMKIELTHDERVHLQARARQRTAPHREVIRARAILMAADGKHNTEIAHLTCVDPSQVSRWKRYFRERRTDGLVDRQRPGRPRRFSPSSESSGGPLCLPDPRPADCCTRK